MRFKPKRKDSALAVNLTPMIDVIFQLLIFFMLVSKFDEIKVDVKLPDADQAKKLGDVGFRRITVSITSDGTYDVSGQRYNLQSFIKRVLIPEAETSRAADGSSDVEIIIRADRNTEYQHAQNLFLECMKLRIYKLNVIAVKDEAD